MFYEMPLCKNLSDLDLILQTLKVKLNLLLDFLLELRVTNGLTTLFIEI